MRVILPTLLCFGLTRLAGAPLEPAKSSGVEFERAYAVVIQAPATTVNVVFEDKAHYRRVDWDRYPDDPDFVVLADTEGNRFCVIDTGRA